MASNQEVEEALGTSRPSERKPVRVPKAGAIIAEQIRRQIVTGDLREGDGFPPEATLMEQFDVSRPTLREAFRILESESLISVRRGRGGARVRLPDIAVVSRNVGALLQLRRATISDVYESRVIIEPQLVARLAVSRTPENVRALRQALERQAAVLHDDERFVLATADFHRLLAELSSNQTLNLLTAMLDEILRLHATSAVESQRDRFDQTELNKTALRAETKLVSLIEAGEAEKAETMWRRHLVAVGKVTLSQFGQTTVLDLYSDHR
jgi:DNA-binding FadR family transcriptional regulator